MPNLPPPIASGAPDNDWIIDGRINTPIDRTSALNRGPQLQQQLSFIPLHQQGLIRVEREVADELHDYIVFTTAEQADQIYVEALLEGDRLRVSINTERFLVIMAGANQFIVFRTQGGNDQVLVADEVTRPVLIDTGDGDDRIWVGGGYARVFAGPGNDTILTRRGTSYIEAGTGADQVIALGDGNMTVYAGPGNDKVTAGAGMAFLHGGDDDDHLTGGSAHNIIVGGPGNDDLQAGIGSNTIYTGEGLDVVSGLKPDDKAFANPNSGIFAVGQLIGHGSTSPDMLPPCQPPQARVTNISSKPLENSGIRIIGSPQFHLRVTDDLQLLASSPHGQKMFDVLHAAELRSGTPINIYELQDETNGMFEPRDHTNPTSYIQGNSPGTPSYGGAVYYNPTYISNRVNNIALLYHELCHAYNTVTGTSLAGKSEDGIDGNKPRSLIANKELQAVGLPTNATPFDFDGDPSTPATNTNPPALTENGIRDELGIPPRKQYSSPPN